MTEQRSGLARRSLIKGVSWAAPTAAFAIAAPAFAASQCTPSLRFSGGLTYNWGTIGASTTNQRLDVGGQTYVDNLPPGVTVTSISYQFWIQNRIGQDSYGPGAFFMGNALSDRNQSGACRATGCSVSWSPTAGSGFATTVTNTANLSPRVYPDGQQRESWDINMRWDPSRDSNVASRYTAGSTGCQNFTTGPSGRFAVNYTGV